MTVRELIQTLTTFDMDMDVEVRDFSGCFHSFYSEALEEETYSDDYKVLRIY